MLRAGSVKGYKAVPPPFQATTWPTRDPPNPALVSERSPMSDRKPLMPKATAVWLLDNTALTFDQVADFTKMHPLEIRAIADGDAAQGIKGMDPISNGQLTREEIEKDIKAHAGEIKGSVSAKLSYLVVGSEAGSKLAKAKACGVKILDEGQRRAPHQSHQDAGSAGHQHT